MIYNMQLLFYFILFLKVPNVGSIYLLGTIQKVKLYYSFILKKNKKIYYSLEQREWCFIRWSQGSNLAQYETHKFLILYKHRPTLPGLQWNGIISQAGSTPTITISFGNMNRCNSLWLIQKPIVLKLAKGHNNCTMHGTQVGTTELQTLK